MEQNSPKAHILVVDDDYSMRELLTYMLEKDGYRISTAGSGREGIQKIEANKYDLLLCDIKLGDMIGLDVLRASKRKYPDTIVIMISAYATTETAVEAMNEGAYDYLPKPFDNKELKKTITRALELRTLDQEKKHLDDHLKKNLHFNRLIGNSPKMLHIYSLIEQVSRTSTNVMITGESGTGKELIARSIHELSDRREKPFVAINCGGIPETLMESELFGHKKGSFTGATHDKKGLFEAGQKGTVFLDEIGELGTAIQVKLLRAVQEKMIKPVGGNENISVDIRIISATNKNLEEEVITGNFREDLFYRLNVIEIKVPPLRERKEDLPDLAQHFLEKFSRKMGKEISKISSYSIELLKKYEFPGNIRELENLMERSVALSNTNILLPESLALADHKKKWMSTKEKDPFESLDIEKGIDLDGVLANIEKKILQKAMNLSGGNKQKAAELVGVNMRSFRYRLGKLGIDD